jgi:hypothetical protein
MRQCLPCYSGLSTARRDVHCHQPPEVNYRPDFRIVFCHRMSTLSVDILGQIAVFEYLDIVHFRWLVVLTKPAERLVDHRARIVSGSYCKTPPHLILRLGRIPA